MIHPLLPAAIRGIIWYQGERNASNPAEYAHLFPAMIRQWRKDFAQGDIPFYFVQLPNLAGRTSWLPVREAQTSGLALENTGMAVTIDIGDPALIHPPNKQDVGKRLALIALANTYGRNVVFSGPVFHSAEEEGAQLRVRFKNEGEFVIRDASPNGFEVAGEDKLFHPADVKIDGQTLIVSSPAVPAPKAVRYAWADAPPVTLYTPTGIPAPPFRSDDWTNVKTAGKTSPPAPEAE